MRVGDAIYGTVRDGLYRRYAITEVLAHWSTVKPAYRVTLEDGTKLVASGDHRFLTERGWKHVTGAEQGPDQRPFLTTNNKLMGFGGFAEPPKDVRRIPAWLPVRDDPRRRPPRQYVHAPDRQRCRHPFRLALADDEALTADTRLPDDLRGSHHRVRFFIRTATRRPMRAIRTGPRAACGPLNA